MDSLKQSISILKNDRKSVITFIITTSISLILILVGIIITVIDNNVQSVEVGESVPVTNDQNTFKFIAPSKGYLHIYIFMPDNVSNITITDEKGNKLVNSSDIRSSYSIYLKADQKVIIEFELKGSYTTRASFDFTRV